MALFEEAGEEEGGEGAGDVGGEVAPGAAAAHGHGLLEELDEAADGDDGDCEEPGAPERGATAAPEVEPGADVERAEHYGVDYLVGVFPEGDVVVGQRLGRERQVEDEGEADAAEEPARQAEEGAENHSRARRMTSSMVAT